MAPQYIGDSMTSIQHTVSQNARALTTKARTATASSQAHLDAHFPPSQRSQLANSIRGWATEHPKLFYFALPHILLTLPPLLIFLTFTTLTLLTSLFICITTAIVSALLFTAFCIGGALLILLPILLIAAVNATGLFVAGVSAYWILARFAESETPVPFAENMLRRLRGVDEGIVGAREQRLGVAGGTAAGPGAGSGAEKTQALGVNGKSQWAGLTNGIGGDDSEATEGREGRPSNLFGILDEDDFGMPDSTKKALRDISQQRERAVAVGQA